MASNMEPSPALKLEQLAYSAFVEELAKSQQQEISNIKGDARTKGAYGSGRMNMEIVGVAEEGCRKRIQKRQQLREESGARDNDLLTDAALDELRAEFVSSIKACDQALKGSLHRDAVSMGPATAIPPSVNVINVDELTAFARRSVETLRAKRDCGLMEKPAPQTGIVTVNASQGSIVAINSAMTEVTATFNAIHGEGKGKIAEALKSLSEAVKADEALGESRVDILEALGKIGEQANLPKENQKLGTVKFLFGGLQSALSMASSSTTIWNRWGPEIQQFFGF
jgi:hypothetical protein